MSRQTRNYLAYGLVLAVVVVGFYRQDHANKEFCRYAFQQQAYARQDAIREFQRIPYERRGTLKIVGITIHPRKELKRNLHGRYGNNRLPTDCPQHDDAEKIPKGYDVPPMKRSTHGAVQPRSQVGGPQALRTPPRAPSRRSEARRGPQAVLNPPKRHLRAQRPQAPALSQPAPTPAPQPVLPEQRQGPPPNVLERICTQLAHLIPPCS